MQTVTITAQQYWELLKGKTVLFERVGSEFLGEEKAVVGQMNLTKDMVKLCGAWWELEKVKVKFIL